jgi:cell division protein FtsZ
VLYSGVACIVDLIVKDGLINLDFADVRTIMTGMGTAMMGTGEAEGSGRATAAAEEAISNPLLEDVTLAGAKGLLLAITGDSSLTLFEVDEAANRVRQEVDPEAVIIVGATFDEALGKKVRVSIVASGMARMPVTAQMTPPPIRVSMAPSAPTTVQMPPPLPVSSRTLQDAASASDLQSRLASVLEQSAQLPVNSTGRPQPHQPPPLPSQSWMAPGNVRIEQQPALQPAPFSIPAEHGQLPPPPAFMPQPPADIRGAGRRIPDVSDFPVVGQRDYHAKKSGWPDQAPPRVLSEPRSSDQGERKSGWFGRFAGRLSGASDSQSSETIRRNTEQINSSGGVPVADDRPGRQALSQQVPETAELPVFFRGGRR